MDSTLNTVEEQPNPQPDAAFVDQLTGVGNRALLIKAIENYLATNTPITVVLLDLDEFRIINDSLGHAFGDQVLQAAAKRLSAVFGDQLFRPGGDEFAVILPTSEPAQIEEITDIVLTKWRTPLIIDGSEIYSGVSIGTVTRAFGHASGDDMFRDAEIAMYEAKRLGRNRAVAFYAELGTAANEELERQMLSRRAVVNREFSLFWQPIFDAQTGGVTACEALLRWRPASGRDTLPAAEFIPFLERSGLIVPVGEQVIENAFQQYALWSSRASIPEAVPISMNLSARQLATGNVVESLLRSLDNAGIDGSSLIIEITESVIGDASEELRRDIQRLREVGVKIAIDDFGGGKTSLFSLLDFPMDIVKLHRSATDAVTATDDNPILSAVRGLMDVRGLTAVATGIENQHQLGWFQRQGWDWLQGFFIAKPADAETVTELLSSPGDQSNLAA